MKDKIRKDINGLRDSTDPAELDKLSERIKVNLFSTPEFMDAKTVMFYISKGSEVRTWEMIKNTVSMGKTVCVPLTDVKGNTITPYEVKSNQDLGKGHFGIPEPRKDYCREVDAKDIDVVIVPGTAFDRKGERIGYGKGYYDRFLSRAANAKSIGLAYGFQVVQRIPSERHDVKVDIIVTERLVIRT
jgi:5-formyltetrahydrofolate cyclo-ligase